MSVVTRFAPSPSGKLHIGGARTALFNFLFARANQGKFLVRMENTDLARSHKDLEQSILSDLQWLGIQWDDEIIYQSDRIARHQEVAYQMVEQGNAYFCFEEKLLNLDSEKEIFRSSWRDKDIDKADIKNPYVIRCKPPEGQVINITDELRGNVSISSNEIDDFVLLRSDGTPTYMLAAVVDDHDMKITHIIRGDDHLTNAAKQQLLYDMMNWKTPSMIHIPLIHDTDGSKLSKRKGALGIEEYKKMGYLSEAMCNYMLRLGWSYGDEELIPMHKAIEYFNLSNLGKSNARLDDRKMKFFNKYYIQNASNKFLYDQVMAHISSHKPISVQSKSNIEDAISVVKDKVTLMNDLYDICKLYIVDHPIMVEESAQDVIDSIPASILEEIINNLNKIEHFVVDNIRNIIKLIGERHQMELKDIMLYVKAMITGKTTPNMTFRIMQIIGKSASIKRMSKFHN